MRISARNQLRRAVESIEDGAVTSIATICLAGGGLVVASNTRESAPDLGLAVGAPAVAVIKALRRHGGNRITRSQEVSQ